MQDSFTINPFVGERVEEIQLSSAPLILVICQMRWPQVTAMAGDIGDIATKLGKAIAHNYPLSSQHKEVQFQLSPQGVTQTQGDDIYEWTSADGDWSILVSQRYLALQTKKYTNRRDFFNRMEEGLSNLLSIVAIPVVERIGFRYTNRISNPEDLERLSDLVKAPVLGSSQFGDGVEMIHTLTEAVYKIDESQLRVRSAQLPRGGTIDPAIQPVDAKSWLLDLDASSEARIPLEGSQTIAKAQELSSLAYAYFRWAVKPEFINHFGGDG
jgi:uncharacterized protein (TIGR04255 family)